MTWTIEGQEPWYVEHPTSPSVTSVGIAKDGVIKAIAVSAPHVMGVCTDCDAVVEVINGRCGCGSGRVIVSPVPQTPGWRPVSCLKLRMMAGKLRKDDPESEFAGLLEQAASDIERLSAPAHQMVGSNALIKRMSLALDDLSPEDTIDLEVGVGLSPKMTMSDEEIEQWIDACNHEPARETLRDYLRLRAALSAEVEG